MKICSRCKIEKPSSDFHNGSICRPCRNKAARESYQPKRVEIVCKICGASFIGCGKERYCSSQCRVAGSKLIARLWGWKRNGWTQEMIDATLAMQNGSCGNPYCDNEARCADHNHLTGEARGMLCNTCNVCLGFMDDNTKKLQGLIEYLDGYDEP